MHIVTFTTKRAHLCGVAFGRRIVKDVHGMTPARFDLLYLIRTTYGRYRWYWLEQNKLTAALGLHPSTVSKMIKRLVEMGWLEKDPRCQGDARTNLILLTKRGLKRINRAMGIVFRRGKADLHHFELLFGNMNPRSWPPAAVNAFRGQINAVARSFGDQSYLTYDFGFEDH